MAASPLSRWVHNWLIPTLVALASAVVTALTSNALPVLADGIQPGDYAKIGGIALAAALGFIATLLTRYTGKKEAWILPAKDRTDIVTNLAEGIVTPVPDFDVLVPPKSP